LPPLRERAGDAVLLAEYFTRWYAAFRAGRSAGPRTPPALTPETCAAIAAYPWPGNVAELEHAVERALLRSPSAVLSPETLGLAGALDSAPLVARSSRLPEEAGKDACATNEAEVGGLDQTHCLAEVVRRVILRTLGFTRGNRTQAARLLGISVRTLYTKLRAYQAAEHREPKRRQVQATDGSGDWGLGANGGNRVDL